MTIKCSVCGREAIYFRRTSGEKLCLKCLEKSILKNIRRGLSRVKEILKPKSVLLYIVPPYRIIEGLTILQLLSMLEEKYNSVFYSLVPRYFLNVKFDLRKSYGVLFYEYKIKSCIKLKDIISSIMDIVSRYIHMFEPRPRVVITPLTLNDFAEYIMESIINGEIPNDISYINYKGYNIVSPLLNTLREDILFLAYHKGIFRRIRK